MILCASLLVIATGVMGAMMPFPGPQCHQYCYEELKAMAHARHAGLAPILADCTDMLLERRPELYSERLCALAKLGLRAGSPDSFGAVLGMGRCRRMHRESRRALKFEAERMGGPFMDIFMRECSMSYSGGYGGYPRGYRGRYGSLRGAIGRRIDRLGWKLGRGMGRMKHGWRRLKHGVASAIDPYYRSQRFSRGGPLPIDVLAQISRDEAETFGMRGECRGLTAEHLAFKGTRPSVLRALSEQCFLDIPPPAFEGLGKRAIKAIRHWPIARPQQVQFICPEKLVVMNWERLGMAPAKSGDPMHPCAGITPEQERELERRPFTYEKYLEQCQEGPYVPKYTMWTIVFYCGLGAFLLICLGYVFFSYL